jgi:cytochrome c
MEALIAYIKFVGKGYAEGMRVAGMGLRSIKPPEQPRTRGAGRRSMPSFAPTVTRRTGRGNFARAGSDIQFPAVGRRELQCGRRHGQDAYAASYIHDNMPSAYLPGPMLSVQQAWDVAAFMISKPTRWRRRRPPLSSNRAARGEANDCLGELARAVEREEMSSSLNRRHLDAGISMRSCSRSTGRAQSWSPK